MATFKKRANGTWRAEVRRVGHPYQSKDGFPTKAEAQRWANKAEFNLFHAPRKTLHDALQRYLESVSIHKRGRRWESLRIAAFKRQLPDRALSAFSPDQVSRWRDERLKTVSTGTVRREMNLFGHILATAVSEWGWLESNPFGKVKRPPDGKPKDRIVTDGELKAFIGAALSPKEKAVALAFALAIETGLRAGEIVGIRAQHITDKALFLPTTKNGDQRIVPLSTKARNLIPKSGNFGLNSNTLDVHFRAVRKRLGPSHDYTFHSARHTAATRLGNSGKLSPFELCAMFGWKKLDMALRYCHAHVEHLADRL